jgi:hypothetical protein
MENPSAAQGYREAVSEMASIRQALVFSYKKMFRQHNLARIFW